MVVGIVLASHGALAEGVLSSGQMIFGQQQDVFAVTLTPEMGPKDFRGRLDQAIASVSDQEHLLFLVDLKGGTPYNQVRLLLEEGSHEDWVAVTGLNLPMLLSAYETRDGAETAAQVASSVYQGAKIGVTITPDSLTPHEALTVAPASASGSKITLKPGTVIGDGHIKCALARIDSRLLHGQVATAWAKQVSPTRIVVVSDGVARDSMRKTLIVEAAPPGVRANVIPVSKLAEIWSDPRFGGTKALLLFENPTDVVRAVDAGVSLTEVNLGSMAHSAGKKLLNDTLSVGPKDVEAIRSLHDAGIKMFAQKVPTDKPQDVWDLVIKAGFDK